MSHEIDTTTGKAAIAYVGQTPWHGLGQALTPGASLEIWRKEAGLDYEVLSTPVLYSVGGDPIIATGHMAHYRSDTSAILGLSSDKYKVVQPEECIEFFRTLCEEYGFAMETAGALYGGKRIWALAKTKQASEIVTGDIVEQYVLLSTTFDGTRSTEARYTDVRVVCNNTLTSAFHKKASVSARHTTKFDAKAFKKQLGVADLSDFTALAQQMATKQVSKIVAGNTIAKLLDDPERTTRGFKKVMDLFEGAAIGADLAKQTRWGLLNAVTEYVDHHLKRDQNLRLKNAWFGAGNALKSEAFELLSK